jgi:hypothetical protein
LPEGEEEDAFDAEEFRHGSMVRSECEQRMSRRVGLGVDTDLNGVRSLLTHTQNMARQ